MKRLGVVLAVCAWIFLSAAQAPARAATSFRDLTPAAAFELRRGERIEIMDSQGQTFKAGFERMTATSLTARVAGSMREFSESDVQELRHWKPDSLKNGILIGLGAGAVTGLVAASAECGNDPECAVYSTLVFVPVYSGCGIGIGAIVDAMIHKKETVFVRPGGPGRAGLKIVPLLARNRAGVRVSFAF